MAIWQPCGGSSQDLVLVKPVAYPDLQKNNWGWEYPPLHDSESMNQQASF